MESPGLWSSHSGCCSQFSVSSPSAFACRSCFMVQLTRQTVSRHFSTHLRGLNYPVTGAWPPTMDSELRFYAALWGAYGFILIAVARNLRAMLHYVPLLAATFFVGGAGRALSYFQVGPPHPFFVLLMVIELV